MLFAALFTDKPDHGNLRAEHLAAHIAWIARNKDKVLVAGSLRHEPADVPKGGLWVVEAESKEAVIELIGTDPFFTCGLRQSVEVFHWSKVDVPGSGVGPQVRGKARRVEPGGRNP